MPLTTSEMLRRLGAGESIDTVSALAGLSRSEFDSWWKAETARRVPQPADGISGTLLGKVEIERDECGVPHIYAQSDTDLFWGFGWAMAQDRLFQLDYLRRKADGRLAEILGPSGLENDLLVRTVGIRRIAEAEWNRLEQETRSLLTAFTAGVNAWITRCGELLPIEFALLDYQPEPWSPVDCLAIEGEFRWYLTGRFPVICMPELAKRALGDGPLYREMLLGEEDAETIVPPEFYPAGPASAEPVGQCTGDPDASTGSNNWVVDGRHSHSGKPLVAGDPHIAIDAVSCWYQVHLCGGSFQTAGMTYVGMPAIISGRNERVAWAITNNICSLRDLYQEQTSADHPDCFLFDGQWEPSRTLTETIQVRGAQPVTKTIRFSRNGPIVSEILPPPANKTGEVSLKWLGAYQGGWLTALLQADRAKDVDTFREGLRPWHVPTFNLVIADVQGKIAMQTTGRIPIRKQAERGYRPGWDPAHQWQGLVAFEHMPCMVNPPRGWIATANNRVVTNDYPYLLHGCWTGGYRARRIRELLTAAEIHSAEDFRRMQYDVLNLRAQDGLPGLLKTLQTSSSPRIVAVVDLLSTWNSRYEREAVGPTIFTVFFTNWSETVAREHFAAEAVPLLMKGSECAAFRLLAEDKHGWFKQGDRAAKLIATMERTLDQLTERFGSAMDEWHWGRLHQTPMAHMLATRGELASLLNQPGGPVRGDVSTVCNSGLGPDWNAAMGAGFRMVADLASDPPSLSTVDAPSQSGNIGSPHYGDQYGSWLTGELYTLSLSRAATQGSIRSRESFSRG